MSIEGACRPEGRKRKKSSKKLQKRPTFAIIYCDDKFTAPSRNLHFEMGRTVVKHHAFNHLSTCCLFCVLPGLQVPSMGMRNRTYSFFAPAFGGRMANNT